MHLEKHLVLHFSIKRIDPSWWFLSRADMAGHYGSGSGNLRFGFWISDSYKCFGSGSGTATLHVSQCSGSKIINYGSISSNYQ